LFADIDIAAAAPDLRAYRAMSPEQLIEGLVAEDPVVHGSCKLVLIERMLIAGVSDIIDFITKCAPHSCAVINLAAQHQG
jgi:hypothetical protein